MQSNKIHSVVLMSKFYSTCFGPYRSNIRIDSNKLYLQTLLCGNTRTTRHVQPLQLCNGWTCRVVCVLPHTKVCKYSL